MRKLLNILIAVLVFSFSAYAVDNAANIRARNVTEAFVLADAETGNTANINSSGYLECQIIGGISGNFTVTDVSVSALVPGVSTTALGKEEDAQEVSGMTVVAMGAVRRDTAASSSGTTGDISTINTDATGNVWTTNAALFAEDSQHTSTDKGINIFSVRSDTATATGQSDGDYQELLSDSSGRVWVNVGDLTPGVTATNLGKAEDGTHYSGDTGIAILQRRIDTCASSAQSSGDYATSNQDANGRSYVVNQSEYAEDSAHVSTDVGTSFLVRRIDTIASSGSQTGDYVTINQDANGFTAVVTKGMIAEDSQHTSTDLVQPMGVIRLDSEASTCNQSGDMTMLQVNATGALRVISAASQVYDTTFASGMYSGLVGAVRRDANTTIASADGKITPIQVNAAGQLKTSLVNVEYAEDSQHANTDKGIMPLARRIDVAASSSTASGDLSTFNLDSNGALYVSRRKAAISIQCAQGDAVGGTTIRTSAGGALKSRIYKITVTTLAAETITITELSGFTKMYTAAGIPQEIDFGFGGILQTTAATAITATSADASACQFVVEYSEE